MKTTTKATNRFNRPPDCGISQRQATIKTVPDIDLRNIKTSRSRFPMNHLTKLSLFILPMLASGCAAMVDATLNQSSAITTVHMRSHEEGKPGTGQTFVVRGSSEARIDGAQRIQMWADINVKYREDVTILYRIKVYRGETLVCVCHDDPMTPISEGGTAMLMMNSFTPDYWSPADLIVSPSYDRPGIQTERCQRLLDCDFTPATPGIYRFEVEQTFMGLFVEINKTDLIVKQKFR